MKPIPADKDNIKVKRFNSIMGIKDVEKKAERIELVMEFVLLNKAIYNFELNRPELNKCLNRIIELSNLTEKERKLFNYETNDNGI